MRLDQLLVARGLFESRERARRAVMAGIVFVDDERVDKPGVKIDESRRLRVAGEREPFVSRAGRKLDEALDHFEIVAHDRVCLDVGASTGGFTDCLLQRGARRVYAIDVGYNQLVHQLRVDDRVVVMERVNARYLEPDALPERCSLMTMDLSFISVLKVMPATLAHLEPGAAIACLIKPQFEAGREMVGKGGIVREESVRRRVISETVAALEGLALERIGVMDCATHGARGNREAIAFLRAPE